MSDSDQKPWSDNPYAPKISYNLYLGEKAVFAGTIISSIFYGINIMLFLQCMGAFFNPAHRRRESIQWRLISYTVIMFAFVTVFTAMNDNIQSISWIDNREFPGVEGMFPPGPLGYQFLIDSDAITIIPSLMFLLNNWLADGFLLYRCYIIYSMNLWVIAFPCLMYLGSVSMGILLIYETSLPQPNSSIWNTIAFKFGLPYFSISVALNILLTLMIVTRLVLHSRNIRIAVGAPPGISGLCKSIVTMLIESSALYAVTSLLFIGLWVATSPAGNIFLAILGETQVIAPLLIIRRIANQSALTSNTVVSGQTPSFRISLGSRRMSMGRNTSTLPVRYPMRPMEKYRKSAGELGIVVETTIDLHRDRV